LEENSRLLQTLAKLESIQWLNAGDEVPPAATQLAAGMEILVPMAGLSDKDAELARLRKEIDKADKEIGRVQGKLGNESFVAKAPADVVEKERAKLADMSSARDKLQDQLEKIKAL